MANNNNNNNNSSSNSSEATRESSGTETGFSGLLCEKNLFFHRVTAAGVAARAGRSPGRRGSRATSDAGAGDTPGPAQKDQPAEGRSGCERQGVRESSPPGLRTRRLPPTSAPPPLPKTVAGFRGGSVVSFANASPIDSFSIASFEKAGAERPMGGVGGKKQTKKVPPSPTPRFMNLFRWWG